MTTEGRRSDGPLARRRRMDRSERRAAILDAALALFASESADDVNIDRIADCAGVSRALVYEYFGDRAKLVEEARRSCAAEFGALLDQAVESAHSADDLLAAFVATHLRYASARPGSYRLATEHQDRFVDWLAEIFGGTADALVVASAAAQSLRAFVLTWVTREGVGIDRAAELIVAFLHDGLLAVRPLGVKAPHSSGFPLPVPSFVPVPVG